MTPRFHPYAPLAAALALSTASLAAAWVGIGPASPGVAAIRITAGDGADDAGPARPATAGEPLAALHAGATRVLVDFTPDDGPARASPPAAVAVDAGPQTRRRAREKAGGVARHDAPAARAGGLAS